ncbi:carbohydrate ABC transporter permease [Alicyclobacillus tolerans]|uniref:Raffinose/stachyose/melibiose transport system permease protein n=1 Tax=Alicyclobacillus tolerans TaxID=90970 RepID=A0ABT9LZ09_9BACL|nr:carbohydrate ABC transporter permease [Alicyclobacillus tengchongensis]MDP9729503.1 raffinose/stachyose/melibiose transport system permease protein [Alicyclobacillus tengchongensis]
MGTQTASVQRAKVRPNKRKRKVTGYGIAFTTFGTIWLIIAGYPLLYMVMTSFRTQNGYLIGKPWLPPSHPTLSNYAQVLQAGFFHYFLNSAIVSVCSVVLIVVFALLLAYVIVRSHSRTVRTVFNVFLVGLALPIQAAIIPVYILINKFGLYDTLIGMILPMVAFGLPLSLLILVNFVRDIPNELYESMGLEGATDFQIVRHLVAPLSMPALVSVGIYEFIQSWNNFLFPLVLTQSQSVQTLPLAIVQFQGQHTIDVPVTMAVVLFSALPLILAYIFAGKYLRRGMLVGFGK